MNISSTVFKMTKIQKQTQHEINELDKEWSNNKKKIDADLVYLNELLVNNSLILNTFKLKSISLTNPSTGKKIKDYKVTTDQLINLKDSLITYSTQIESIYEKKKDIYKKQLENFNNAVENDPTLGPLFEVSKILKDIC